MTMTQSTYTPLEAASFLGITEQLLDILTNTGKISRQRDGARCYYLGGELDAARCALQSESRLKHRE